MSKTKINGTLKIGDFLSLIQNKEDKLKKIKVEKYEK